MIRARMPKRKWQSEQISPIVMVDSIDLDSDHDHDHDPGALRRCNAGLHEEDENTPKSKSRRTALGRCNAGLPDPDSDHDHDHDPGALRRCKAGLPIATANTSKSKSDPDPDHDARPIATPTRNSARSHLWPEWDSHFWPEWQVCPWCLKTVCIGCRRP